MFRLLNSRGIFLYYQKILFIKTNPHKVSSDFTLQIMIMCALLVTAIYWPQELSFHTWHFFSSSLILHISTHLLEAYLVCTWSNHIESFLCTWGWSKAPSVTFPVLVTGLSDSVIIGAEIQPNSLISDSLQCCICSDEPTHFICIYTESAHCKFHSSRMTVQIVEERGNKKRYYRFSENQWEA